MMESASKQPNCIIIAADKDRLTGTLPQCATSLSAAELCRFPEQHDAIDKLQQACRTRPAFLTNAMLHSACRKGNACAAEHHMCITCAVQGQEAPHVHPMPP